MPLSAGIYYVFIKPFFVKTVVSRAAALPRALPCLRPAGRRIRKQPPPCSSLPLFFPSVSLRPVLTPCALLQHPLEFFLGAADLF